MLLFAVIYLSIMNTIYWLYCNPQHEMFLLLKDFDGQELTECIKKLIRVDREWVPHSTKSTLYIRPTMIGTEVSTSTILSTILCQHMSLHNWNEN